MNECKINYSVVMFFLDPLKTFTMKKTPNSFCVFDLTFFFSFSSALLHGPIFLFDSLTLLYHII